MHPTRSPTLPTFDDGDSARTDGGDFGGGGEGTATRYGGHLPKSEQSFARRMVGERLNDHMKGHSDAQSAASFSAIHRRLLPRRRLFSLLIPPAPAPLLFCPPYRLWLRRPVVTAALAVTVTRPSLPPARSSSTGLPHSSPCLYLCFRDGEST
ncbi:hypothetical protein PIB30_035151 [Stylosanthes scabra]|uniref:Uncharacterized protein n=1 Tax=Stylosanthes scabra TaxID=79078 RepID=A0ABU6WBF5_9FABA|nr:hypothetical protein [Stylosanthes scabra]